MAPPAGTALRRRSKTAQGILDYVLTDHAEQEISRRQIDRKLIYGVITSPEQRLNGRAGRDVLQSRVEGGYRLRVFVDVDRQPPEVVTAYLTSKLEKYWSQDP